MKKIFILLAILALASCEKMGKDGRIKQNVDWSEWYYDDEGVDDGKPRVMIMSFNVRYKNGSDKGDNHWDKRKQGCYAMINTLRPIVMGVQECKGAQRDDLINNCPGYEAKGRGRKDNYSDEQCAIFYLKDSVSVEDYGNFWLTETPDKVSKYPQAGHYRLATWIKFKHKKTGNEFYHLNTHLDLTTTVRDFEMRVIMDQVAKKFGDSRVVFTGDWNASENDAIFTDMYSTFQSARATANVGDSYGTTNDFTSPNKTTKIDHIFYRGFSGCTKFMTVKQSWEGYAYISDHYPVYAILKF